MVTSTMSKIVVIKPLQSNLININQVLRTDIEASNRGISALSSSGVLTLVSWIKKKVLVTHVEDVSDALWQKGGVSELIAACHSGALFRYAFHQDTGLTKTLQLSAQSLLSLINTKDSSIRSLKSLRIWGHTKTYILLQPQPDRLVLMYTNSGGRPNIIGIIKTPNLQSAHIAGTTIIVQPCTGSDIYIHDATNCKTIEVVTLMVNRPGVSYIQWDCLACSFSASRIAVTDSERRLYVAQFEEKKYHGKKNGIKTFHLNPHQVVWPAEFHPSSLHRFILSLSEDLLSVFCSAIKEEKEEFYYFTYDASEGGSLSFQYKFTKQVSLLPGLSHELPDLFLTDEGLCMLTDKECQVQNATLVPDFESLLESLEEALKEEDMDKISRIKVAVEEDLGIFLSSCNHMEGWVNMVETRSQQHAQLVNTLLSHLTKSASECERRPSLLGLKELAKHHFKTLQDEMSNVLKYVDAEKVSQLLLIMVEQMNFYLKSVETMKLPEGTREDRELLEKFEVWGDRPIKDILTEALNTNRVKMAETYLSMKPWIYGQIETSFIVSSCIDIARKNVGVNLLLNMEESYIEGFKANLFASKELKEIHLLEEVLNSWEALSSKETLSLYFVKYIHQLSPHMISKPPKFWTELITYEDPIIAPEERELTIGLALRWSIQSINLVLIDLFARVDDEEILKRVEISALWKYLLIRKDETQLLRWVSHQICGLEEIGELKSKLMTNLPASVETTSGKDKGKDKPRSKPRERKLTPRSRFSKESLLGGQMYYSDTESLYSVDSSVLEGADESLKDISESSEESLSCYVVNDWSEDCFVFITQNMTDEVLSTSYDLREKLLNIMGQYGVFVTSEKEDPQKMIKRLIALDSSLRVKPLSEEYTHRVDKSTLDKLVLKLFVVHDLKSPFYEYVNVNNLNVNDIGFTEENSKPWMKLVSPFQAIEHSQAKETIYDLCLETLSYFLSTKGNLNEDYLSIFLTMLYAPHASLKDFLGSREERDSSPLAKKDVESLREILSKQKLTPTLVMQKLATDLPYLQPLIQKPLCLDQIDISVYDLLRGSIPFDISGLFTWQKYNKYGYTDDVAQPTLSDENLSKKDGVKCSLDYYYYLKAGRPTYALASILLTVCLPDDLQQLQSKELSVYGLALSSWPDKRICSACVALLFIAQLNYETLRTVLFTADLIIDTLEHQDTQTKIHENLRKSQLNLLTQEVKGFLFRLTSLSTRAEAAAKLVSHLEDSIIARVSGKPLTMSECPSSYYGKKGESPSKVDFSSKENLYYIIIGLKLSRELSALYNLTLPQKILEFLARENQWLMFLVGVQLFRFPSDVVRKTCSKFDSQSLKEHVQFCLDISKRKLFEEEMFREKIQDEDEPKSEGDYEDFSAKGKESASSVSYSWDGKNLTFKNRRRTKRKKIKSVTSVESKSSNVNIGSDYSRIPLIGSTETNHSVNLKSQIDPRAYSHSHHKTFSPHKWEICEKSLDVFSVVLKCHKQEKPALELLESSIALKSPILAVLSACYDSNLRLGCLAAWLYSYIPVKVIRRMEVDKSNLVSIQSPTSVENLMSWEYLEKLIAFYLSYEHMDMLTEAFKVFNEKHLVLPLIQGLECTKRGNNESEISKSLTRIFNDSFLQMSVETDNYLESAEDISKLCITTVCQGLELYLKNRSLQKTFMQTLLPFCDNFPFRTKAINWNHLCKILNILGSINTPVKIFQSDFSLEEFKFDAVIKNLVKFLIEIEEYERAFEAASLLNLDTADIFCCQLESEFDLMKKNALLSVDSLKMFLADSHSKMTEKRVPIKKASLLFESIAKSASSPFFSFLALQYAAILAHKFKTYENDGENNTEEMLSEIEENWAKKTEKLELRMWCSYIEAKVNENSEYTHFNFTPPECFEKWPWEYGTSARWLNYDDIERASVVSFEISKEEKFVNRVKKYFKGLFKEKNAVQAEEILRQEITSLIKEALEQELLVTANRIEKLFSLNIEDVSIMKDLLKKACVSPESLRYPSTRSSPTERHFGDTSNDISKRTPKRILSLRLRSGSFSHLSPSDAENTGWLASIYRLSTELSTCYRFAQRMLMMCRIAEELSTSYLDVIHHKNPTQLLTEVFLCGVSESLQLAKELIDALPIPTEDVNSLLFVEVLAVISAGPAPSPPEEEDCLLFSWKTLDQRWMELLCLTDTPSGIGHQLMEAFHSLSKDLHPDRIAKAQTMSVEVLIRAHDCFSQAANMEGINIVLQASPNLTKALLKHNQWSLMGRLLAGIKRYKEMSYIIDVMREHQQFERLLGRTSDKNSKLQSSGLDKTLVHFLHSSYPEDKEMLRMVALHFLMFSELAKMWEEEAEEIIKKVLDASLYIKPQEDASTEKPSRGIFFMKRTEQEDNASSTSTAKDSNVGDSYSSSVQVDYLKSPDVALLTEAMRCYCYASQYCIQEKQLMSAMRHSRQAELIAVQLNLIKAATNGLVLRVIKLSAPLLNVVMGQYLSAREVVIVARSYGVSPDWPSALYFHYIKKGHRKLLDDFLQFSFLTADIALDIVKKIERHGLELDHKERMGKLLCHVADVDVVYKIASQLSLRNKGEECLESNSTCYLKDTVFSKGIAGSGRV